MDIGCGRGGDLNKYNNNSILNYIGVDVSLGQLRDAFVRRI